jgi:predicted metal-dependent hydrolase
MDYKIIRTKRRTLALHISSRDAMLTIRAPLSMKDETIYKFLAEKSNWIRRKQTEITQQLEKFKPKQFTEGEEFLLAGRLYPLHILPGTKPYVYLNSEEKIVMTQACLTSPKHYMEWFYKQQAKQMLTKRTHQIAEQLGYNVAAVKINSARTRWGSCSMKNTINFSWRLVLMPWDVIDYVIIHELIHIDIKNHSRRFYARMLKLVPDYIEREKRLKEYSAAVSTL